MCAADGVVGRRVGGGGGGLSCEESFTLMIPGGVDEEEGLLRGYMEERRAD